MFRKPVLALALIAATSAGCGGDGGGIEITGTYNRGGFPVEYGEFVFTDDGNVDVVSAEFDSTECVGEYDGSGDTFDIEVDCDAQESMDNPAFSVEGEGTVNGDGSLTIEWGDPVNKTAEMEKQDLND